MSAKIIPILAEDDSSPRQGFAHASLRIFQVFVNIEGIRVPIRHPVLNIIPWRMRPTKTFGFYAVLMLAAEMDTRPPMLLSMATEVLADEFGQMSKTTPDTWQTKMEQWREIGLAPPMFQQTGCIEDGWGAAWYELDDKKAKGQRYRLTKIRLWKGCRAKPRASARLKLEHHVAASEKKTANE